MTKKNAAFRRPGNVNTLKTGKNSARVKSILDGLKPAHCAACDFTNCPERVQSADSVCAFHEYLCQLGDMLMDHSPQAIQEYLTAKVKVDSYRYQKALMQESQDAMGLDPEVARLSASINRDLRLLAQISMPRGPLVAIDQRQIHLHGEMQAELARLSEDQYVDLLKKISELRAINATAANALLCGASLDDLEGAIEGQEDIRGQKG